MTKAVLIVPANGHGYQYPIPKWACGLDLASEKGIGKARNAGAKRAIEFYNLKDEDWLIFVDDDTEIPATAPFPPENADLAVPLYKPVWPGADSDIRAAQINFVNFVNAVRLGPITVGSCIAVKVGAFGGGFEETEDLIEDVAFGVAVTALEGRPWGLWRTPVLVHRRYRNEWLDL